MWPLLVLLIPLFGYMYVETDHYLKYKLKKLDGWHAYFLVSVQGLNLLLLMSMSVVQLALVFYFGMLGIFIFIGVIDGIVNLWNVPSFTFTAAQNIMLDSLTKAGISQFFEFITFISNILSKVMTSNRLAVVLLIFLSIYSIAKSSSHASEQNNKESIEKARQAIAKDSKVDAMIFEAEKFGLLIMITLKSRKVYVGQILSGEIGNTDLKEISLIPILSGYRDKDTLTFKVEHDYSDYYAKENITESSSMPLSHFQQVIFYEQIESMSLFDSEVYKKFQENKDRDEKIWKKLLNKIS